MPPISLTFPPVPTWILLLILMLFVVLSWCACNLPPPVVAPTTTILLLPESIDVSPINGVAVNTVAAAGVDDLPRPLNRFADCKDDDRFLFDFLTAVAEVSDL